MVEAAAVAVAPPEGGPDRLVVFVVVDSERGDIDPQVTQAEMQAGIRHHLNPLFRIHDVVVVDELPRTASNKVMRRTLRAGYSSGTVGG